MDPGQLTGRISGLQISAGGVPKLPVLSAELTRAGMAGDRQRNLKYHGGLDRALCLLAQEIIDALVAEGHPITRGSTGENITIAGLVWSTLKPGDRLRMGVEVLIEITTFTPPCRNIAGAFHDGDFSRLKQELHPGCSRLYARVLVPGRLAVGDEVALTVT